MTLEDREELIRLLWTGSPETPSLVQEIRKLHETLHGNDDWPDTWPGLASAYRRMFDHIWVDEMYTPKEDLHG